MTTTPSTTIPSTIGAIPFRSAELFGDAPAQRSKREGAWHDISYRELAAITGEVARGLIALGVEPGARVAVLSETRAEWMQAAFGIAAAGAVIVPIYATNSPEECEWVLRDSGAVAVICEDAGQVDKIARIRDSVPDLQNVLTLTPVEGHRTLTELREEARDHDDAERERRTAGSRPENPAIIIYTSGTTGKPKGCVLTHRNLTSCAQQAVDLDLVFAGDVAYLFLPLAHVFAQTVNLAATGIGCVTAYVSAGPASIMSDVAEVRPTYFPSVPRIFEKVYSLFATAPRSPELFERVRALFGGRLRVAISGAAPIAPEILEFFHAAGVPVYEGYGLSESTAYGTVNLPGVYRIGSIGRPMPFGEVLIADDGEILMRGPHIFAGYWNNPEATRETLTADGWLRTGDLGHIDEDGYVTITGRKKEIIITAGGKNITPSEIEGELRQCPLISNVLVHGDRRPYPVALITLDAEYVVPWAAAQGLSTDLATLSRLPRISQEIQTALDAVNARHAKAAQVKRFVILPHDFSQETGELTPTLKMKRRVINDRHADVLDALYSRAKD